MRITWVPTPAHHDLRRAACPDQRLSFRLTPFSKRRYKDANALCPINSRQRASTANSTLHHTAQNLHAFVLRFPILISTVHLILFFDNLDVAL